jgi:glutathione S-transferase
VRDLESEFNDEFGRAVARTVYHHLFTSEKGNALLCRVWKVGVTPLERVLTDPLFPACRFAMFNGMGLQEGIQGHIDVVNRVFGRVSDLLADGRRYIGATEEMTAADVTFASLAYPLVLPEEKADVFVSWDDELPDKYREDVRRLRETLAGQFVLRLYKEERHV